MPFDMSSPVSPFSQAFVHHLDYALRLVESPPSHSNHFSRQNHIESCFSTLTEFDEDHVLRNSRLAGPRSASSALPRDNFRIANDHASVFPGPVLSEIDPNNQRIRMNAIPTDSPSASLKKKKAEQILKQHGSPPGIRVTAGGRIVPSEQSPLCSPRYGYSAVQRNGGLIKFAPGYPPPSKSFSNYARTLPNGWVLQDPSGILVQVVDGRLLAINEVDSIPQLYITAPNLDNAAWAKFHEAQEKSADRAPPPKSDTSSKADSMKDTSVPSVADQLVALEKQYQKLESERRSLDKTEVLKRSELTGGAYNQLVQKRRELIERQDEVRRSIKALKESKSGTEAPGIHMSTKRSADTGSSQFTMNPGFLFPGQTPLDPNMSGVRMPMMMPAGNDQVPILVPQGFYPGGVSPFFPMGNFLPTMAQMPAQALSNAQSAYQMPDMSHAPYLPFFNPVTARSSENEKDAGGRPGSAGLRSGLNPMSPVYEPSGSKPASPEKKHVAPFTQDFNNSVIITAQPPLSSKDLQTTPGVRSTHNSSEASYATADFFPHNPRDHSLHKETYPVSSRKGNVAAHSSITTLQSNSEEAIAQPEMERHNSNWNPTIPDQAFQKVPRASQEPIGSKSTCQPQKVSGQSQKSLPRIATPINGDYAEGYRAGLVRAAIGNESQSKEWLDGYCKGLLESVHPAQAIPVDNNVNKLVVRLPSAGNSGPPHTKMQKLDSTSQAGSIRVPSKVDLSGLKDLVNSPANENAILSPDPEGPHVDSIRGKSLGSWSKENSIRGMEEPGTQTSSKNDSQATTEGAADQGINTTDFAQTRVEPPELTSGNRAFSAQVQPTRDISGSYFQRAYGAHRVLSSPMDWKSANSVAQVAGLANGYFAQFDGTLSDLATYSELSPLTRHPSQTGTSSKPASKAAHGNHAHLEKLAATKFKEATMTQDEPASPGKASGNSSPKKTVSPAKAKFAAIAGKAGIKVRTDRPQSKESNDLDHLVPRERRPWRYVWKGRNTGE
ncbi:hypothetical protein KVT40_003715 [Elsinoe batatas]|uniref:Uncharacterized protein n=1 Tax=Elsinoe batatas TaxID=2601811 RepID=A0A8K0PGS5_9PEZI|nr:hypothetical protein KVT40_003715 [Elsinoe batatas]